MKISKVEFENFRNFRDYGCLEFSTNGGVSVIYGPNGVGKTTLHQLFQWIFYGEVHFNKTASNKMYNLDFEDSATYHQVFSVFGAVEFEHPDKEGNVEYYRLRREWRYRKEQNESKVFEKVIKLAKKIGDDWKKVPGVPEDVIEQILPSGLSQYFFFDGESMIADLNQKGKDSAKSLRKALYSIFDLDVYDQAIVHIGAQNGGSSTVLGKLYLSRAENSTDRDIIEARGNYRQALRKVETLEADIASCKSGIARHRAESQKLSEQIGNTPSREQLEKRRKTAKNSIKTIETAIEKEMKAFGVTVMSHYPYVLLSRVVEEAQLRIGLKVEDEKLLPGLRKELILALLDEPLCICGNPIHEKEKLALKALEKMFPPLSYKYIYDQFKSSAIRWSATYDGDILLKHLDVIFEYRKQIAALRQTVHDIDEEEKQSGKNVDELIAKRQKEEETVHLLEVQLSKHEKELGVQERLKAQRKKKLDELLAANTQNQSIDAQIEIMERVKLYFETIKASSAKQYSESLRNTIQELLREMLTSTRFVSMSPQFELSVKDSHGDEAKSEGQFAVVSFAYIGGIFKLLREVEALAGKEFPLILDGPFSKLDVIQRQNVIDTIPAYAPQVILFSKDDLSSCFGETDVENVWTIFSNEERNVSCVKKGYFPEVFTANGTDN